MALACVGAPKFERDKSNTGGEGGLGGASATSSNASNGGSAGGGGQAGESSGDGGTGATSVISSPTLVNRSFEAGLSPWRKTGDDSAAHVESLNAYHGTRSLRTRSSTDYSVSIEQELGPMPATAHTLRAWFRSSVDIGDSYLFFRPASGEERREPIPPGLSSALRLTLGDLQGPLEGATVGVHIEGPPGSWVTTDAFEFFAGAPEWHAGFLLGGDVTFRTQLNDAGVTFYDDNDDPREVLEVLQDKGFNLARFRLHNDPGSALHYPSNQWPAGYQNLDDTLRNGKDCADHGMELLISFHYSDYWTNPGQQYKPHQWEDLDTDALEQALYDYTYEAIVALMAQGTPPLIVSLGNETNAGMLWPEGRIGADFANFDGFARLFNAGARAVRAANPDTLIAVHISEPGATADLWLEQAAQAGLDYDVVGLSLYPFWSNISVDTMKKIVARTIELTGKRVLAVETGYPWTLERPSGYPTMIESNNLPPQGPETFGVSPRGQELFLRSMFQQLHDVPGFLGASYWDPIWIEVSEMGANVSNVGDTALFDWDGAPLQALEAFGEKFH